MSTSKKSETTEVGDKEVPSKYRNTAQIAVQFSGKGINSLRALDIPVAKSPEGEDVLPLPEAEVLGSACAGNLLFAQGIELIFKLIFIAEEIDDKGFGQHDLVDRFEVLRKLSPLRENIEIYMPMNAADKAAKAVEVVKVAEEAFMPSRYLGFRKGDLVCVNSLDAAGLLLSLTLSYRGLQQIEAARLIGLDITNKDGSPINSPTTKVQVRKKPS